jgi:hypothetical protein
MDLETIQDQESQNCAELAEVLDELANQGKYIDIQVCPKCKSPKIHSAKTTSGDLLGHMGMLSPKYECLSCGWQEKLVLKATNKPLTVMEVELITEARTLFEDDSGQ